MKRTGILIVLIFIYCISFNYSFAGWLAPDNYEDCILEGMKGVTSDVAAKEIKKACRKKFPIEQEQQKPTRQLTPEELSKIEGSGGGLENNIRFYCELYNGNTNVILTEITIEIQSKAYTYIFSENYRGKNCYPRSTQRVRFIELLTSSDTTNPKWSIIEARGYDQ